MAKRFFVGLLSLMLFTTPLFSQSRNIEIPRPRGFVNDFAGIFTRAQTRELDSIVLSYEAQTTNEIAVVTLSSLNNRAAGDVALAIGRKWGVGKKGASTQLGNNGIVILLAPNEREVFISVGTGLEGSLTDVATGRIIDERMIPHLSRGREDWYAAMRGGVEGVITALGPLTAEERIMIMRRDAEEARRRREEVNQKFIDILLILLLVAAFVVPLFFVVRFFKKRAFLKDQYVKNGILGRELSRFHSLELLAEKCQAKIRKIELKYPFPSDLVFVKDVLKKVIQELDNMNEELEKFRAVHARGWKESVVAYRHWHTASETAERVEQLLEEFQSRCALLEHANNKSPELLEDLPSLVEGIGRSILQDDVSEETRAHARELITASESMDISRASDIGWLAFYDLLVKITNDIHSVEKSVVDDIEFAKLARKEGNNLFSSIPGLIKEVGVVVEHADVSSATRKAFISVSDDYGAVVKRCSGANPEKPTSVKIFRSLLDISERLKLIKKDAANDKKEAQREREEKKAAEERRRQQRMRSSYSSSGGGSLGGGSRGFGGGGGFSGGGAGRRF